jgi:zinc/manganese transport system substrate-binding protein
MIRKIFPILVSFLLLGTAASAKLNIVTTLPWIGSLTGELGQDRVKVTVLVKPNQDPHYVEAKPSMILEVRKADLLLFNGLDLEIGYLPVLVESSRNPKIQPGNPGFGDCSQFIEVLERPKRVDRSMGDVHPQGNPHYHLSPKNIFRVAEGIAARLSALDPAGETFYRGQLASFKNQLAARQKEWERISLSGKKFLPYHKFFEYLAADFGFELVGYIEPKPGIPPSAAHLEKLIGIIKKDRPDALLVTSYYGTKEVSFLSQKTDVKYLVVPHDVGSSREAKDWLSLMDQIIDLLK